MFPETKILRPLVDVETAVLVRDVRFPPTIHRVYAQGRDDYEDSLFLFLSNQISATHNDYWLEKLQETHKTLVVVSTGIDLLGSVDARNAILDYRFKGYWKLWGQDRDIEIALKATLVNHPPLRRVY